MSEDSFLRRFGLPVFLVVLGLVLIFHHGLVYGLWFDFSDFLGHDWVGLVLVVLGFVYFWRV